MPVLILIVLLSVVLIVQSIFSMIFLGDHKELEEHSAFVATFQLWSVLSCIIGFVITICCVIYVLNT